MPMEAVCVISVSACDDSPILAPGIKASGVMSFAKLKSMSTGLILPSSPSCSNMLSDLMVYDDGLLSKQIG